MRDWLIAVRIAAVFPVLTIAALFYFPGVLLMRLAGWLLGMELVSWHYGEEPTSQPPSS